MPEHFEEWWGYGVFFLVAALVQGAYGAALLRRPGRALFLLGVGGNLAIIALYLLTRTAGVPLFGPEAGVVEGVGTIDLCAAASELALVVALGALLLGNLSPQRKRLVLLVAAIAVLSLGHLVHLLLRDTMHGSGV